MKAQIEALKLNEDLNIKEKMSYSFNLIGNLGKFFQSAPCEVKIKLLGSIFPEKIEFDGKKNEPTPTTRCLALSIRKPSSCRDGKRSIPKTRETSVGCPERGYFLIVLFGL